jgi:hypothetical protein
VVLFISREGHRRPVRPRLIGLGLITLALQLIVAATRPLIDSPAVRTLLASLPNDVLLDILVGAVLTVLSYSAWPSCCSPPRWPRRHAAAGRGAGPGAGRQRRQRRAGHADHGSAGQPDCAGCRWATSFKLAAALLVMPWLPQVRTLLQNSSCRRCRSRWWPSTCCSTWRWRWSSSA